MMKDPMQSRKSSGKAQECLRRCREDEAGDWSVGIRFTLAVTEMF